MFSLFDLHLNVYLAWCSVVCPEICLSWLLTSRFLTMHYSFIKPCYKSLNCKSYFSLDVTTGSTKYVIIYSWMRKKKISSIIYIYMGVCYVWRCFLSVCKYLCVKVCVCISQYIYIYSHMLWHARVWGVCVCLYEDYISLSISLSLCVCVCVFVCLCVCVCLFYYQIRAANCYL